VPYNARRLETLLPLDGSLAGEPWKRAKKSPAFVDMASGKPALLDTRASVLWDDEHLHVGFWVADPYPRALLTERDSLIFRENDIELFIDGGDCYYELELNALNTVYEVFFIWKDAYRKGGVFDTPEFDVFNPRALTFAGDYDRRPESFWWGTHPRGPRWAFLDWDLEGLQTAVHVNGELNSMVPSVGWTAHLMLPWAGMRHLADGRALPPHDGDVWNLFLGRFQHLNVSGETVQAAWCWSPHGVYDTHQPEKFTPIHFSSELLRI
jgi:hypothetical protein